MPDRKLKKRYIAQSDRGLVRANVWEVESKSGNELSPFNVVQINRLYRDAGSSGWVESSYFDTDEVDLLMTMTETILQETGDSA